MCGVYGWVGVFVPGCMCKDQESMLSVDYAVQIPTLSLMSYKSLDKRMQSHLIYETRL